jgi:hypothetical protein
MMGALATKQPGIPGRTFSRTFCPGSVGTIKAWFLPGQLSGHFVRIGRSLIQSDRKLDGAAQRNPDNNSDKVSGFA